MIDWKVGAPKNPIKCCLVIYMEDYEFAEWDGNKWLICFNEDGVARSDDAQEPIKFYAQLNMPDC